MEKKYLSIMTHHHFQGGFVRIVKEDTLGLVIDLQERLVPHMDGRDGLIEKNRLLLQGLRLLDVPVLFTEQYPRGLGKTIDRISEFFAGDTPFEKISFSCCDDDAVRARLQSLGKKTVLIAGVEAHVCVLQTALDICSMGMAPVVVADAVSSRREYDKRVALDRIAGEGGRITTVESVLFELMRTARHPSFKTISNLVK